MFILQDLPHGLLKVCILTEAKAESHIYRTPIKERLFIFLLQFF